MRFHFLQNAGQWSEVHFAESETHQIYPWLQTIIREQSFNWEAEQTRRNAYVEDNKQMQDSVFIIFSTTTNFKRYTMNVGMTRTPSNGMLLKQDKWPVFNIHIPPSLYNLSSIFMIQFWMIQIEFLRGYCIPNQKFACFVLYFEK